MKLHLGRRERISRRNSKKFIHPTKIAATALCWIFITTSLSADSTRPTSTSSLEFGSETSSPSRNSQQANGTSCAESSLEKDSPAEVSAEASGKIPTLNSLSEVFKVSESAPPGGGAYKIYKLKGDYPIYFYHFRSTDSLIRHFARTMARYDLADKEGLKGVGNIEVDDSFDVNGDGVIDIKDAVEIVRRVIPPGKEIGGVHYSVGEIVTNYNYYKSAQLKSKKVKFSDEELKIMQDLETEKLITKLRPIDVFYQIPGRTAITPSIVAVPAGADHGTIRHELNHAVYNSVRAYRDEVKQIWENLLREDEGGAREIRNKLAVTYKVPDNIEKPNHTLLAEFSAYGRERFESRLFEGLKLKDKKGLIDALLDAERKYFPFTQDETACAQGQATLTTLRAGAKSSVAPTSGRPMPTSSVGLAISPDSPEKNFKLPHLGQKYPLPVDGGLKEMSDDHKVTTVPPGN